MATRTRDPYEILGVARDASADDVRSAYRRLARQYHPDVNKEPGAEDRFKEVAEAYETLRDPERRAEYDSGGRTRGGRTAGGAPPRGGFDDVGFDGVGFGDIFGDFFGGRRRGRSPFDDLPMRGSDQEAVLELSLEEAATGGQRSVALADGREYDVNVPRGVRDGQLIRLAGEGGPGTGGAPDGDLLLRVRIRPHPRFRVDGSDLYGDLPVTPSEAALGDSIEIHTLSGTATVRVPRGTSSGRKLRLKGEGMPRAGGGTGDLYVTVSIKVPRDPADEERELYERLRDVSSFRPRGGVRR
jgi:curved DNA-binding protein